MEWFNKYHPIIGMFLLAMMIVPFGLSQLMIPKELRGGVMGKLQNIHSDVQKTDTKLKAINQRLDLILDIETQKTIYAPYPRVY